MKRLAFGALLAVLTLAAPAGSLDAQQATVREDMLVSPAWLASHLSDPDLVVVHVARDREAYDSGHIPGARFVAYGQVIVSRGDLHTELPEPDRLRDLVESLGIGNGSRVIITGELLPAARLYFTLDYLGHGDRTALLNGGLEAWRAGGGILTRELPPSRHGSFVPALRPDIVISADQLRTGLERNEVTLIDARSLEEYDGERGGENVLRTGHIPGARHLEWSAVVPEGTFPPGETLAPLLREAGAGPDKDVVTYCRVGTRAAVMYFAARYLGLTPRLYDGSMEEWSGRSDLPVVSEAQGRKPVPR